MMIYKYFFFSESLYALKHVMDAWLLCTDHQVLSFEGKKSTVSSGTFLSGVLSTARGKLNQVSLRWA